MFYTYLSIKHLLLFSVSPVSVEISNKGDQLVVGRQSEVVCRSSGSRPPAHITWYLGGVRIEGGTESVNNLLDIPLLRLFGLKKINLISERVNF